MAQSYAQDEAKRARQEVRELSARFDAFAQQRGLVASQLKLQALEAALRTAKPTSEPEGILYAAKAYEAYLKGE